MARSVLKKFHDLDKIKASKSVVGTITFLSAITLLSACSFIKKQQEKTSGEYDYLNVETVSSLRYPEGIASPEQNSEYEIPMVPSSGLIGRKLDLRPPVSALAFSEGDQTHFEGNTIALTQQSSSPKTTWLEILDILKASQTIILHQASATQQLETDWVEWADGSGGTAYRGRYEIALGEKNNQQVLTVRLLELQRNGTPVEDPSQIQRYAIQMFNMISMRLYGNNQQKTNSSSDVQQKKSIEIESGVDEVGLPNLVLRVPFDKLWARLPELLEAMGMVVKDRQQDKGSLSLTFKASGKQSKLLLPSGNYKLQVGDLDNRSSLQFSDAKGQILTQEQNNALLPLLQDALNK